MLAATRLDAPAEALAAWTRAITAFKRSQFVLAIGRFSDPPVLSDLDALALDDRDVDELRRCRPGDCGLKLSAAEISRLSNVAAAGGAGVARRGPAGFRQIVLNRVQAYRAGGLAALPPPADRDGAPSIGEALASIVERSPHLDRVPGAGQLGARAIPTRARTSSRSSTGRRSTTAAASRWSASPTSASSGRR